MDKDQKPLIDNENITTENSSEYTFVEERIVTKRHRVRRVLTKFFVNLLMPVCACALVCYLYFSFFDKDDDDKDDITETTNGENSIIVNGEPDDNEQPTGENEDPENLDIEENLIMLEEKIQMMTVTISVIRNSFDEMPPTMEKEDVADYYTGVIISMNGPVYILLPEENITGYKEMHAIIDHEIVLPVTVYDTDEATGLALLKIEDAKMTSAARKKMSVAKFEGFNQVNEGSTVVYCGNVVGNTPMFVKGHISNSKSDVSCLDINYDMLVTDIVLENVHDGFIFNAKGDLVGIVGLSTGNLNIPNVVAGARAFDLEYIINNMLNDKSDIYIGIVGQNVSAEIEAIAGGKMPRGIYISSVLIDSPAYNAGIMPGDIIYSVDGLNEPDMNKFRNYVERKEKGDTIKVKVKRKIGNVYNVYSMVLTLDSRD